MRNKTGIAVLIGVMLLYGCASQPTATDAITPTSTHLASPTLSPTWPVTPSRTNTSTPTITMTPTQELQNHLPSIGKVISLDTAGSLVPISRLGKGEIYGAMWSGDGKTVIMPTSFGIFFFDSQSRAEIRFLNVQVDWSNFDVSPDGSLIASGFQNGSIKIWRLSDGRLGRTITAHGDDVNEVAFSPDGEFLASSSSGWDTKIWRVSTGDEDLKIPNSNTPKSLVFAPDGKSLAIGMYDGSVELWNSETGRLVAAFSPEVDERYYNAVTGVVFSPDGSILVHATQYGTWAWKISDGTLLWKNSGQGGVDFSSDGTLICTGTQNYGFLLWHADDGSPAGESMPSRGWPHRCQFSPDGTKFIAFSDRIEIGEVGTGESEGVIADGTQSVFSLAYSPNGKYLAAGGIENSFLWFLADGSLRSSFNSKAYYIRHVAFAPDSQYVASSDSQDNSVKIWQTWDGMQFKSIRGFPDVVRSVAFSPDGRMLATISNLEICGGARMDLAFSQQSACKAVLRIINFPQGTLRQSIVFNDDGPTSLDFSPDGSILAVGGSSLHLWDVSTWSPHRTMDGDYYGASPMLFSPDGTLVLAADSHGQINIWNVANSRWLGSFDTENRDVINLDFSPDGTLLAIQNQQRSPSLWRVSDWSFLRTLEGHHCGGNSIAFSPDGESLAMGSDDGTICLWGIQ